MRQVLLVLLAISLVPCAGFAQSAAGGEIRSSSCSEQSASATVVVAGGSGDCLWLGFSTRDAAGRVQDHPATLLCGGTHTKKFSHGGASVQEYAFALWRRHDARTDRMQGEVAHLGWQTCQPASVEGACSGEVQGQGSLRERWRSVAARARSLGKKVVTLKKADWSKGKRAGDIGLGVVQAIAELTGALPGAAMSIIIVPDFLIDIIPADIQSGLLNRNEQLLTL